MELEQKMAEQLKNHTAELDQKMNELEASLKAGAQKEDLVNLEKSIQADKELQVKMQEQLDTIAKSIKENAAKSEANVMEVDPITTIVKNNFEAISNVDKGHPFKTSIEKGMTLPVNLVGDAPRDYSSDVVKRPAQKINVADLGRVIPITGGTYTYYRSTLTSGTVGSQTEGSDKNELVYTYTSVDASTDFIAGYSNYSKKMRNNLPWLEATLSTDLMRDYYKGENAEFEAILAAEATASTVVITGNTKAGMLVDEMAKLEDINHEPTAIVVRPSDWYDILKTPKDDLEAVVTFEGGVLRINGTPCYKATWLPANKYYVGDWSRFTKAVTEGFSFEMSEEDVDNFRKNNITARVEAQVTCAVEQPDAIVYGDFLAV